MAKKRTAKKRSAAAAPRAKEPANLLDGAAAVLRKARRPMSCPEIVEAVLKAGTWSTEGKTPAATLSAAIHRDIRDQGKEARFVKHERGRFRLSAAARRQGKRSA